MKVDPSSDRRKRRAGDEGEQWALAATLAALAAEQAHIREVAIDALISFLSRHFKGDVVDELLHHGERARLATDDEDFVHHASMFLHVSTVSDAFGFDVLGWGPTAPDAPAGPLCLEVKSAGAGGFHFSSGEWKRARLLHDQGEGDRYAILVVVRSRVGAVPKRMDLLPDPVALVEAGKLQRSVDGYSLRYEMEPRS